MEDHLRICEVCLDNYLAAIEPRDEAAAAELLPADFTARVIQRVTPIRARRRYRSYLDCSRVVRSIQYYTIAAAITLLLLASGWFDYLAAGTSHSQVQVASLTETVEERIPFGWSERLVANASDRLTAIIQIKGDAR